MENREWCDVRVTGSDRVALIVALKRPRFEVPETRRRHPHKSTHILFGEAAVEGANTGREACQISSKEDFATTKADQFD